MTSIQLGFAIIVVWYNPTNAQIWYSKKLATLWSPVYIIDNSPGLDSSPTLEAAECHYYWMGNNLGIATALNHGCKLAMTSGSEYVLMLDQDSVINPSMLHNHIKYARAIFSDQRVAVVSTSSQFHVDQSSPQPIDVKTAITSGSIIRLSSWCVIGGFNDALFIDQVDHDFCIRLRLRGFRVLVNPVIVMQHRVGDPIEKKTLGFRISSTNHHWIRRYYQVRNSLYLRSWYPTESKPLIFYLRDLIEMIISILVLEDHRKRKLYAILIGIVDFYRNRTGAWEKTNLNAKRDHINAPKPF